MKTRKIIIVATLAALAVALISGSIYAYNVIFSKTHSTTPTYTSNQNSQNMMGNYGQGMSGMMGITPSPSPPIQNAAPLQGTLLPIIDTGYVATIAGTIFGAGGLVYVFKYQRKQTPTTKSMANISIVEAGNSVGPYDSISKTLTAEERHVLGVLSAHSGKYLQKYIKNETGLSRLKAHRIVSRLAERGIVTLERTGNTNEVILSDWLQHKEPTDSS